MPNLLNDISKRYLNFNVFPSGSDFDVLYVSVCLDITSRWQYASSNVVDVHFIIKENIS